MKPVSTTTHVLCTGLCAAFCLFAATQISFANSAEGLPPLGPPALGDPTPSPTPKGQPPPPIQPPAVPNTSNNYTGTSGGSLVSGGNWSLSHVPTVSEDATYTGTTTGNRTITANTMTVGSFNLTGASGTFTISNNTG